MHLNLLLYLGRYLARGRVNRSGTARPVSHAVRLSLLQVDRRAVVLRSSLREQIVLVRWRLQMLVSSGLHILRPRNLYLNVRPIPDLLMDDLLLSSRAVEVLSRLIHNLVLRGVAHRRQVHMLSRAAPSRPSAPLRCVVSVSLNALDQFTCFWVDLSEWIDGVVLIASVVS